MKISDVEIRNGVFLAPMAGVTDHAFRYMCKKHGAGGMTTEMVSAKAICYGDKKTVKLARIDDGERPCGLQLFGSEPDILAKAAVIVYDLYRPEFIDINMGCPAPKIVNNGEGSSLLKNPVLCGEIVKQTKAALDGRCPLTVKIRRGFDRNSITAAEVAKRCEDAGADAIFVHARTREQMYMPPCEYSTIAEVKEAVSIPVIGNGDIDCGESAVRLMKETGCDGIMIGRAAMGNPFVFDEINSYIEGRPYTPPTVKERHEAVCEHINLLIADKGEYIGVREARKHVAWYIKGLSGAAAMRNRVNLAESKPQMLSLIDEIFGVWLRQNL